MATIVELRPMQSLRPSNRELVAMLYRFTELEVAMRRAGNLRTAVLCRRMARYYGRMIVERIEVGLWDG